MEGAQAFGAEGVAAVDQNARDLVADVELVTAKVTKIQATSAIISLYLQLALSVILGFLVGGLLLGTLLAETLDLVGARGPIEA